MNWFVNMYSPITERTDITGTLMAYDNYQYNCASMSFGGPVYNFSKGQNTNNSFMNYAYNVNPYDASASIFGNLTLGGQNNSAYSPLGQIYNFTGRGGGNGVSRTSRTSTVSSPTRSNTPSRTPADNSAKVFAQKIASNAEKYVGYNELDGSFRRFSNDKEWCADFVTYVVKETYLQQGKTPPAGFGSWRCENLKRWAIKNNKFLYTAGQTNKQDIIKNNVKPGDIVIMRENGASHTGIVKSVDRKTGEYVTIEGNVRTPKNIDAVVPVNHSPFETDVSGFIQLV